MAPLYPSYQTLQQVFGSPVTSTHAQSSLKAKKPTPYQARTDVFAAYSVVDDAKNKAQLSAEAKKELELAIGKKPGVELYSGQYYAACTFGGLLACVGHPTSLIPIDARD
jgi:solute carrier family 25 (mitochondrial phosphate transporter), member 3